MLSPKFIGKYMRRAKQVGTDLNPCYSRQIGVVIVDHTANRILGTGYNGPAPGTPHCDSFEFLQDYFWPQLTESEKDSFRVELNNSHQNDLTQSDMFARKYMDCGQCPRRLVKAKAGERSELCSCGHAERHAITNAACDLSRTTMFCWCGVPCLQCTDAIIQAGIENVVCLPSLYHEQSLWLFNHSDVMLWIVEDFEAMKESPSYTSADLYFHPRTLA